MAGSSFYSQNIFGNKRRKMYKRDKIFKARDMAIYFLKQLEYPVLIFS